MRWTELDERRLRAFLEDPETPPSVLACLVRDANMHVAELAAANPSLPERSIIEAVGSAIQHGHHILLEGLASNPSLPKGSMPQIVRHGNVNCLDALAANPSADLQVLTAIYQKVMSRKDCKWSDFTLLAILDHPACSVDLMRKVLDAGYTTFVMTECLERDDLPSDIIDRFAKIRQEAIESCGPEAPGALCMTTNDAWKLGERIASHPHTPLHVLTVLAMDPDPRLAEPALDQLQQHRRDNPALFVQSQDAA